jgi:hypothetical protein
VKAAIRILCVWLLVLAVPLQAAAAVRMAACKCRHGHGHAESRQPAPEAARAGSATTFAGGDVVVPDAHAADGADADRCGGACACAACCAGAAPPFEVDIGVAASRPDTPASRRAAPPASPTPDRPERPPRPYAA